LITPDLAALHAQATREYLLRMFHEHDTNRDGVLSLHEFGELCTTLFPQVSQAQADLLFIATQDASIALKPEVGDELLPEAFVATMFAHAKLLAPPDAPDDVGASASTRTAARTQPQRSRLANALFRQPEETHQPQLSAMLTPASNKGLPPRAGVRAGSLTTPPLGGAAAPAEVPAGSKADADEGDGKEDVVTAPAATGQTEATAAAEPPSSPAPGPEQPGEDPVPDSSAS
jgi:hypothetical protein